MWARPIIGWANHPRIGLSIELIKVGERARGKEIVADIANGTLDPAFLVAASHRHRAGLEVVVRGKGQQCG